jgi:apolipoprotein N-acyltransferase
MLLFLPALTGLLLVASFPRAGQGYLAWVAFVPLMVFVVQTRTRTRAFMCGFLAAAIELFVLLIWIPEVLAHYGGLPTALAWVAHGLMVSVLACYPAVACAVTKHLMIRGGKSFFLLFPVLWVLFEYAQSFSPFGGLPWLLAGYSQSGYLSLIQIADITGVYGVSFLVLWVNAAIVWTVLNRERRLLSYAPLVAAGLLTGSCLLYGSIALRRWESVRPDYRAAMLQGNLSVDDSEQALTGKFVKGYLRMADRLKPSSVDLLVLPESPSPVSFQDDASYRRVLQGLADRFRLGLIFNNIRFLGTGREESYFNSAYFLDRNGTLTGIYDKMHLVPFGEYIPLKKLFSFAETISKDVGGFSAGQDYRIVEIGGNPSNAIICFEAIFPGLVRRFVDEGSQLIVNLTNDGWYGRSAAPYQHLAITRFRAVENRRYLLRATNSGFSAIIEPTGRIQASTGLLQEAICEGRFAFLKEKTPFTCYGDVFIFLCAIISCGLWVFAELPNVKGKLRRN